eukprot:11169934-Lingulodinium_polyedra.AAC.1
MRSAIAVARIAPIIVQRMADDDIVVAEDDCPRAATQKATKGFRRFASSLEWRGLEVTAPRPSRSAAASALGMPSDASCS